MKAGNERISVPVATYKRLVEVAREFRKEPTPSERLLWRALRGQSLLDVRFRRQQPIGPFVVDFFCAQQAVIVEVNGPIHDAQKERDNERQLLLEACGYHVLRIMAHDVEQNMAFVLERIRQAISPRLVEEDVRLPRGRE